jgi:hypothetical protein
MSRKYISEFGLNSLGHSVLIQRDGLDKLDQIGLPEDMPLHIYMIARRPRITLDPASIQIDDQTVRGRFNIQRQNTLEPHDFILGNELGTADVRIDCPYPHTEYTIHYTNGQQVLGKAALLMSQIPQYWPLLDLEVLYVGQSSRAAPERLRNHSTLQEIYAEAIQRSPDQEIWLVLWNFQPFVLATFDGRAGTYDTTLEEDDAHMKQVTHSLISEQQQINFTEAALIRYFQPEYNVKFKNSFPSATHDSYSECYEIDLNLINVELQTEMIRSRLWSKSRAATWVHFATFEFHSSEERRNMFEFAF